MKGPTDIQLLALLERTAWKYTWPPRCQICRAVKPDHEAKCKLGRALAGLRERVERQRIARDLR